MTNKVCPNCGGTEVRVYNLTATLQLHSLETNKSDHAGFDFANSYTAQAFCANCDTDLLHLIPNPQYLAEEPSIRKLVDAACAVIALYDQYRDVQEVGGDPLKTVMEDLATATDAIGGESR